MRYLATYSVQMHCKHGHETKRVMASDPFEAQSQALHIHEYSIRSFCADATADVARLADV